MRSACALGVSCLLGCKCSTSFIKWIVALTTLMSRKRHENNPMAGAGRPSSLLAQANCVGLQVHGALATPLVVPNVKRRKLGVLPPKGNQQPNCTTPHDFAYTQPSLNLFSTSNGQHSCILYFLNASCYILSLHSPLLSNKLISVMRLLKLEDNGEFSLIEFVGNETPRYAILSHTWGADNEEATFKDLLEGTSKSKAGYEKIRFCKEQAANDGLQYFWVDTCCIDKSSSAELTEAINSMFRWYQDAAKCYVYLSDVLVSGSAGDNQFSHKWKVAFKKSRWFTRGWTLQELIAPASVEFFSKDE